MKPFRTPEMAYVAAACAYPRRAADRARLSPTPQMESTLDWSLVARLAAAHHVTALVADAAPPAADPARAALAAAIPALLAEALRHAHETHRLAALLEAAGIPVTVLKGAVTAMAAFGRQGLRQAIDIDLLVAPGDVPSALALLAAQGYRLEADPAEAHRRGHKDLPLWHPMRDITLELHWRLFQNPRILPVPAARARVDILPGRSVATLCPLDEALYLCCHGAEHGWERLKWLADLTALLRRGVVQADTLYARARAAGLARMVGPGLVLAHRLHATPLPARLARDLRTDWRMRRLLALAWRTLAGHEDGRTLEQRPGGATAKNLSHYLFSADPRRLWHEARYDLRDRPAGQGLAARLAQIWHNLRRRAAKAGAPA